MHDIGFFVEFYTFDKYVSRVHYKQKNQTSESSQNGIYDTHF